MGHMANQYAADAGGEGHGPHRLEFTDGEGWNDFLAKDPNK